MRAVGDRMIVAPPLIVTRAQLDEMFALIVQALDRTYAEACAGGWVAEPRIGGGLSRP
jgi:putrescine aminotransferase